MVPHCICKSDPLDKMMDWFEHGMVFPLDASEDQASTAKADIFAKSEPLDDVMNWLEHANLSEEASRDSDILIEKACRLGGGMDATVDQPAPRTTSRKPPAAQIAECRSDGILSLHRILRKSPDNRQALPSCRSEAPPEASSSTSVIMEEIEWEARRKQTGAVGHLVVYERGDDPKQDFLLRGGKGHRILVTAVTEGGKAHAAGVRAGDALISMDGRRDFSHRSADDVHEDMQTPLKLVFMGFVGKLQAEVRLNSKRKVCGLSSKVQLINGCPQAPVQVMDEVVFQPGSAALLLATDCLGEMESADTKTSRVTFPAVGLRIVEKDCDGMSMCTDIDSVPTEGLGCQSSAEATRENSSQALSSVFELRDAEARHLLQHALSIAQQKQAGASPGHQAPGHRTGATTYSRRPPHLAQSFSGDAADLPQDTASMEL